MIRLGTVVLGAEHVGRAVAFWRDALGYEPVQFPMPTMASPYPSDHDFIVMSDTEGNRFCVVDASHG